MENRCLAGTGQPSKATSRRLLTSALFVALLFGVEPVFAQSAPSASEQFEDGIEKVATALQANPRLKKLSQQQRQKIVEFIAGNMLFTMLHELSHAAVNQFDLPVVGREEDGADSFASVRLIQVGSELSHRVVVEAAKGWFLSDRRDRRDGEKLVFYDEHGLDKACAYNIVCLIVGSEPGKFSDLANETKLPPERQQTCPRDYAKAARSWVALLKPYQRAADQPKAKIEVMYGEGKGNLGIYAQAFRALRLLETVAEPAADQLAWPAPFTMEMQSCGDINAAWVNETRKLTLCYELAADFAELYRDFGASPAANKKGKSKSSAVKRTASGFSLLQSDFHLQATEPAHH
jgi:hypothetical protein